MKKNLRRNATILIAVIMTFLCSAGSYAEGVDVQGMDTEALIALRKTIDMELKARPEASPFEVTDGIYVIGDDIPVGDYYISAKEPGKYTATFQLYASKDKYHAKEFSDQFYVPIEDDATRVVLDEGNVIEVGSGPIMFSTTPYEGGRYYVYTPPEGTLVPAGIYTVGIDIPAGTYQFYDTTLDDSYAKVEIYQKSLDDADSDSVRVNAADLDRAVDTAILYDGNILDVRNDIIMKKQSALNFD